MCIFWMCERFMVGIAIRSMAISLPLLAERRNLADDERLYIGVYCSAPNRAAVLVPSHPMFPKRFGAMACSSSCDAHRHGERHSSVPMHEAHASEPSMPTA